MMKKNILMVAFGIAMMLMTGCGSSKGTAEETKGRVRRSVEPTYKLAREEGANLRAASSATSQLEDVALENAENAAVELLASRLESSIVIVGDRYNNNQQVDKKTLTEQQRQNEVKRYVSQTLSYKVIGDPSIYDNPDGTITAYVCVELTTPTEKILEDAYDKLTQNEVLQLEFDRKRFIEENKEELKKLQNKLGL